MKTIDIKRANFSEIFAQVEGLRALCWFALGKYGPGTTRQIADWTGLDLLTVRPRVTELCDLGFAYLSGRVGREGVYAARDYAEAAAHHARLADPQMSLSLQA